MKKYLLYLVDSILIILGLLCFILIVYTVVKPDFLSFMNNPVMIVIFGYLGVILFFMGVMLLFNQLNRKEKI